LSTVAPSPRLGWRLLPGVLAAAVAVISASLLIATLRDHPTLLTRGDVSAPTAPAITAAPWKTEMYAVGSSGGLSKAARKSFDRQRAQLRPVVRNVAGAIGLEAGRLKPWLKALLTPATARAISEVKHGLPGAASSVEVTRRTARVGLQAPGFGTAAARVQLDTHALLEGKAVHWRDSIVLWLERAKGGWKVIAFDLDRRPVK
jgi:hypothetical protein